MDSTSRDKKKRRKIHLDPRIKALTSGAGIGWKLAGIVGLISALLIIIGISSVSWLRIDAYTVRYEKGILQNYKAETQAYDLSRYGLYLTYFNGGTDIRPWSSRVNDVCGAYSELASAAVTNGVINIWSGACTSNCVGHFKVRCAAYKQMASVGFVVLAFLIAVACIIIAASVWLFVFGKSVQFLEVAYLGGGFVGCVVIGYWIYAAKTNFRQLGVLSFFPDHYLGWSMWTALSGCILAMAAGLWVLALDWADSNALWKIKQEKIIANEVNAGAVMLPPPEPAYVPPPQPAYVPPPEPAYVPPPEPAYVPPAFSPPPVQTAPPMNVASPIHSPPHVAPSAAVPRSTYQPPTGGAIARTHTQTWNIGLPQMAYGYHETGVAPSHGQITTGLPAPPRTPAVGQFRSPVGPPPPMRGSIRYT